MSLAATREGANQWGKVKKLVASDAQPGDHFGWEALAISGDTVVVGAWEENAGGHKSGAAYVFKRNQGGADNWGEVKKLVASDAEADDWFGMDVAISADTVVVGAKSEDAGGYSAGAAYVFKRNQGGADNWGEVKKLVASDAKVADNFGSSVGISGDTVRCGRDRSGRFPRPRWRDAAGAAYVFERNQGGADNWGEVKKLVASDFQTGDTFGVSTAISVDTIVVGAYLEDSGAQEAGAAYVYQRDEGGVGSWGEVQKIVASDAEDGDLFGYTVAVSGDTLVTGAYREDAKGYRAGAVYVFERNQGGADNWGEVKKLVASDAQASDFFGRDVALDGHTVILGAYGEDAEGDYAGAAYLFDTAAAPGVLTCDGGLSKTVTNGVATFSGCAIDTPGEKWIHAMSSPPLTTANTAFFDVVP